MNRFAIRQTAFAALAAATATLALSVPQAQAANIITFGDTAQACGSAVLCSTNTGPLATGTQGYVTTGSTPFNLSTITQWFQIDPDGVSHLANQPAEPDGGAGGFLVINDIGSPVTSFSLTLTDTFTSTTPSVGLCSGSSGPSCDNFRANKGNSSTLETASAGEAFTGADFFSCTNGGAITSPIVSACGSTAGQAAANFTNSSRQRVTYNWFGLDIPNGTKFDITFASWNNAAFTTPNNNNVVTAPEPGSLALLGSALAGLGLIRRRRKSVSPSRVP